MRQGNFKNKTKQIREGETTLTQEQLAEALRNRGFRVTGAYISQIEAGLKHVPYGLAIAICEELGYQSDQVTDIFLPENFTGSLEGNNTPTGGGAA